MIVKVILMILKQLESPSLTISVLRDEPHYQGNHCPSGMILYKSHPDAFSYNIKDPSTTGKFFQHAKKHSDVSPQKIRYLTLET